MARVVDADVLPVEGPVEAPVSPVDVPVEEEGVSDFSELQSVSGTAFEPAPSDEEDSFARAHISNERKYNSHPDYEEPLPTPEAESDARSLWLDIPLQTLGTPPRVYNKLVSTVSDIVGFGAAKISEKIAEERLEAGTLKDGPKPGDVVTQEQIDSIVDGAGKEALNDVRTFFRDYFETGFTVPEAESTVARGYAEVVDFIVEAASGTKVLKALGLGAKASLGGGVAAAGFVDEPDNDTLLQSLTAKFPNELEAVKLVLDAEDPDDVMIKRGVKSLEELALIMTADKVVQGMIKVAPEGVKQFADKLPEMAGLALATTVKAAKGLSGKEVGEASRIAVREAGEKHVQIRLNIDNLDVDKPIEAQLSDIVRIDVDGRQGMPDEATLLGLVDDMSKQITEAMRGLPKRIASEKGISVKEAKALLPKELVSIGDEAAKVQAANILVESQIQKSFSSMKAYTSVRGSSDEALVQDLAKKATNDFNDLVNVALPYWQTQASAAGKALQKTTELSPAARTILSERDKLLFDAGRKELSALKGDEAGYRLMVEKMNESIDLVTTFSADPNVLMKHLTKALQKVGDKKTTPVKLYQAFESSYINGILSSPITQGVNLMSAELMYATRLFDKTLQATPGIRKAGDPTYTSVAIEFGEVLRSHVDAAFLGSNAIVAAGKVAAQRPQIGGIKSAFNTEFKKGQTVLEDVGVLRKGTGTETPGLTKTESRGIMELDKLDNVSRSAFSAKAFDAEGTVGSAIDFLGFTAGSGFARETMRATDNMAKAISVRKEMRGHTYNAIYVDDVLGLDAMVKSGKNIDFNAAQKRIEELILNGGEEVNFVSKIQELGFSKTASQQLAGKAEIVRKQAVDKALEDALAVTFQKRLGGTLKSTQNLLQNQIPGGKFIVPFFTTPVNIFSEMMYRTPVITFGAENVAGLPISPRFYKDFSKGGASRRDAVSRAVTGNAIFVMGMKMYDEGKIVPHSDGSKASKDLEKSLGLTDMAIVDDDESIDITKLAPMVVPLMAGANMRHAMGKEGFNRAMGEEQTSQFKLTWDTYSTFLSDYMLDLPLMSGPKGVVETVTSIQRDPESGGERLVEGASRFAGAATPASSMMRFLSRQDDKYLRDMSTFNAQIKTLYFQNDDVPAIYNALGEPVEKSTEFWNGMPLNVNKIKQDEIVGEMLNTGFAPERFNNTVNIDGIKLELKGEHLVALNDIWRDEIGIRDRLSNTIGTKSYSLINEVSQRGLALSSTWRAAKKEAIEELVVRYPELEAQLLQKIDLRDLQDIQVNNDFRSGIVKDIVGKSKKPKLSGIGNIEKGE